MSSVGSTTGGVYHHGHLDWRTRPRCYNGRIMHPSVAGVDVVRQLAAARWPWHLLRAWCIAIKRNVMLIAVSGGWSWRKILDRNRQAGAGLPQHGGSDRRRARVAMGTPAYMSPGVVLGAGTGGWPDRCVFVGVLFFELLAGFRPRSAQPRELMRQHRHSTPRSLRGLGIPRNLRAWSKRCWLSPGEQPTMGELLQALAPPAGRISAELSPPAPSSLSARAVQLLPTLDSDQSLSSAEGEDSFIAGPPIAEPRQFFGRQREVRRLFGLWRRTPLAERGHRGSQRSGKTSLLHYLRQICGRRTCGRISAKTWCSTRRAIDSFTSTSRSAHGDEGSDS